MTLRTDATLGLGLPVLLVPLLPEVAAVVLTKSLRALAPAAPALSGAVIYALCCWLVVAYVYWASKRHGAFAAVFAFRRPTASDFAWALAGLMVGIALFPLSEALAKLWLGGAMHGMRFDLGRPDVVSIVVFWAVATAPFCEEALFRGLAVAALRDLRAPVAVVASVPTLMFAAIHIPYFGWGGAQFILVWGAVVMGLRLRTGSLTAGYMMHVGNNVIAYLIIPLLGR